MPTYEQLDKEAKRKREATESWTVRQILTQNAASLVGSYYIEYVGK